MRTHDEAAIDHVAIELTIARDTWPNMRSGHEAYAIILEELEEFWHEVQLNKGDPEIRKAMMRKELTQVAAMAIRAMVDVC